MRKSKKFTSAPLRNSSNNENINTESETSAIAILQNDVRILKENSAECKSMLQQLINSQAKSNILLKEMITQKDMRITFPIKSLDELRKDEDIGENRDRYVAILNDIIGQKKYFCKRFANIVSGDVILKINYDGVKNMTAFKDFKNLNNSLFECLKAEGCDDKSYAADIRKAIKLFKGRHFKMKSVLKKSDKSTEN